MLLLVAVLGVLSWLIGRSVLLQLGGEPAYAAEAEGEGRHVSTSVDAASGKVPELLRRSGEIGKIASVIKEIATQLRQRVAYFRLD